MADTLRIIEVREGVRAENDRRAAALRQSLRERGLFFVNLMSAPGSGKTTLLLRLLPLLQARLRVGVLEADIDADTDARAVLGAGYPAVQLHTGGMCHLDADMAAQGLRGLDLAALDMVILENVGNLVCPAEFDTGAEKNIMLLSAPEGDDKPLKYPLMFQVSDLLLLTKLDAAAYFDFDPDLAASRARARNPGLTVLPLSARTGEGVSAAADWLLAAYDAWREGRRA